MTAFRSQTDTMLAAKYDPEPWLEFEGTRHSEAPGPGDLAEFDPRPVFIPFEKFDDDLPPVNPILIAFRLNPQGNMMAPYWGSALVGGWRPVLDRAVTPEQIDHARKVLTRLAALA